MIAVSRLVAPNGAQLRAELGNAIAIKAYREGTLPFPDGTIVAALHWTEASSDANNKILAIGFPGAGIQSFVPGSAVNIQFMVKDSKKYSATGGWGFGDFTNGKPGADALMKTCFACHVPAKDHDYVYDHARWAGARQARNHPRRRCESGETGLGPCPHRPRC